MKTILYSVLLGLVSYGVGAEPIISSSAYNLVPVPQKLVLSLKFNKNDQSNDCQDVYGSVTLKKVGKYEINKILFDRARKDRREECGILTLPEYVFTVPSLTPDDSVVFRLSFMDRDPDTIFDEDDQLCIDDFTMKNGDVKARHGECRDIRLSLKPYYEKLESSASGD